MIARPRSATPKRRFAGLRAEAAIALGVAALLVCAAQASAAPIPAGGLNATATRSLAQGEYSHGSSTGGIGPRSASVPQRAQ